MGKGIVKTAPTDKSQNSNGFTNKCFLNVYMKSSIEFSDQKEDFYIITQEISLLLPGVCPPENSGIFCIQLVVEERELQMEQD